jgi:serine/threonine protein kinase
MEAMNKNGYSPILFGCVANPNKSFPHLTEMGDYYLILEKINGYTFARSRVINLMQNMGKESFSIWMQLFVAIELMRSNGITHNDIKPQNLMINIETRKAFIIDFGLSKGPFISQRYAMGTPGYMSNNRLNGGEYTSNDDLLGLAVSMAVTHAFYESARKDVNLAKILASSTFKDIGYGVYSSQETEIEKMSLTTILTKIIDQDQSYKFEDIMSALKKHCSLLGINQDERKSDNSINSGKFYPVLERYQDKPVLRQEPTVPKYTDHTSKKVFYGVKPPVNIQIIPEIQNRYVNANQENRGIEVNEFKRKVDNQNGVSRQNRLMRDDRLIEKNQNTESRNDHKLPNEEEPLSPGALRNQLKNIKAKNAQVKARNAQNFKNYGNPSNSPNEMGGYQNHFIIRDFKLI